MQRVLLFSAGFDPITYPRKMAVLLLINAVPVSDELAQSVWLSVPLLQLVLQ